MALKMAVVVDYQNVHLIAAGLYMPGRPPEEALNNAARTGSAKVEAAKWYHPGVPSTRGRIKTERRLWTTSMTEQHFLSSLDPIDYT